MVRQRLHVKTEALAEKYLGLPTALGRSSKEAFEYISTRMHEVVCGWSGKDVSCAGREILVKSVAQAIPTYSMSCLSYRLKYAKR